MAHYLIVSESEVDAVQEKADFLVPDSNSATLLQEAFDSIAATNDTSAVISIWMAGIFDLDSDVTPPDEAWIRGLGYNEGGPPCG